MRARLITIAVLAAALLSYADDIGILGFHDGNGGF
jgi:hypothetical protein